MMTFSARNEPVKEPIFIGRQEIANQSNDRIMRCIVKNVGVSSLKSVLCISIYIMYINVEIVFAI